MKSIDKNKRLCSKEVQSRIKRVLDIIDSESLLYSIMHNAIELWRLQSAIKTLKELRTNKRVSQVFKGDVTA